MTTQEEGAYLDALRNGFSPVQAAKLAGVSRLDVYQAERSVRFGIAIQDAYAEAEQRRKMVNAVAVAVPRAWGDWHEPADVDPLYSPFKRREHVPEPFEELANVDWRSWHLDPRTYAHEGGLQA